MEVRKQASGGRGGELESRAINSTRRQSAANNNNADRSVNNATSGLVVVRLQSSAIGHRGSAGALFDPADLRNRLPPPTGVNVVSKVGDVYEKPTDPSWG